MSHPRNSHRQIHAPCEVEAWGVKRRVHKRSAEQAYRRDVFGYKGTRRTGLAQTNADCHNTQPLKTAKAGAALYLLSRGVTMSCVSAERPWAAVGRWLEPGTENGPRPSVATPWRIEGLLSLHV